jgi:hypothetical protein
MCNDYLNLSVLALVLGPYLNGQPERQVHYSGSSARTQPPSLSFTSSQTVDGPR